MGDEQHGWKVVVGAVIHLDNLVDIVVLLGNEGAHHLGSEVVMLHLGNELVVEMDH